MGHVLTGSGASNRIALAAAMTWRLPSWAIYVRTMGLFCLAWYAFAALTPNKLLLPSPIDVALAFWESTLDGELLYNAAVSLSRLVVSATAAALLAIPLGLLVGMSLLVEDLLAWPIELLRPISGIAWIPLALFIFGIGHTLPIFIMFYTAFFPLLIGTAAGVRNVDRRLVSAGRTMGLAGAALVRRVVFPAALPTVLTSARIAIASSWTAVVAAELVGAPSGLGYAIEYYRSMLATPSVMAFIFTIGFLGFLSDQALRLLTRTLLPWSPVEARQ